jgi:translation initiation factor IF-2
MSNTKFRIYDLSKELNLENKDLLAICDRLNIEYKSHSSTISEEDAARVRAMAPKYQPSGTQKARPPAREVTPPRPLVDKKPTIVAVKHLRADESEEALETRSAHLAPVNPPRPPAKPQASPASPVAGVVNVAEEKNGVPRSSPPILPKPSLNGPKAASRVETEVEQEAVPSIETPARPPARPTPIESANRTPEVARKPVAPSIAERPRRETREPATSDRRTAIDKPERPALTLKIEGRTAPTKEVREPLELKRPNRPAAPAKAGAGASETDSKTTTSEEAGIDSMVNADGLPIKKVKRPAAPARIGAKKSTWEEEEEEERKAGKVAKTAGKNKRRERSLFEEDEELDEALKAALNAPSFSLSTARPPKPPSAKTAATPAPAQTVRVKRPTKPDAERRNARVDRREVQEESRPESIVLERSLTVRDLAETLRMAETEIIKILFFKGMMVNVTQTLDMDTIEMIAKELGITVEAPNEQSAATKVTEMLDASDLEKLQRRPPVVTIMGHVDHGKTTLLDSIRKTKVAQGEAGGITQHIGAYHVDVEHNGQPEQIVFLDTPGHEAFTAMRARGARVTDIAVLVVAADDGVQPQTREAISHARAAGVPIVVAINKVDKPDANPDRIKQELTEQGLVAEDWGGETIMVPVSALRGQNLDNLLEMILLVSEVEELSANPDRPAKGTVIEANLDRSRGPVATLLVQNGTLKVGDCIVAGSVFGKIRAMIDDRGAKVEAATPSFAVEILGLSDVPAAGDEFDVYESEKEARSIADVRSIERRNTRLQQALSSRRVSLSTLSAQAQEGQLKELNLILKADVQGSVEAILGSLQQLPQNEVQIRILLASAGEVTETDVDLAAASGAVIVGFNTTLASGARSAADREGVDIRDYNIIYKLLDDIQGAMEGLLDPEEIEEPLGQAEVRAVFPVGRGAVAGCYVQSGKLVRNRFVRVRRGKDILYQGVLDSLKRMKEDAREVNTGFECGVGVARFNDWKEGDILEAYDMVMKRRTLSS